MSNAPSIECTSATIASLAQVPFDRDEFEDQIRLASREEGTSRISVVPITPGLSGAAVFLARRVRNGRPQLPWVIKVASSTKLISVERDNYRRFVRNVIQPAPELILGSSSKMLIYSCGGSLAHFEPTTLRAGYARSSTEAVVALMKRIVTCLKPLHHFESDTKSCVERIPNLHDIPSKLEALSDRLPSDTYNALQQAWNGLIRSRGNFPHICSPAHGDLNAGNILFEPGKSASYPLLIDFASMQHSKDSVGYETDPERSGGRHLPFWDYAKLERDVQTRLFLLEAQQANLDRNCVIRTVRGVNGGRKEPSLDRVGPVEKLCRVLRTLRKEVQRASSEDNFGGCYRPMVAYAMLTVLWRQEPDTDVDQDLQLTAAAEASLKLLQDPRAFPITAAMSRGKPASFARPKKHVQSGSKLRVGNVGLLAEANMTGLEFIRRIIAIDFSIVPNLTEADEAPEEEMAAAFVNYPDTWRVILDDHNRIVGYWHFVPLKRDAYRRARLCQLRDRELVPGNIRHFGVPGGYNIYIAFFGIVPEHRNALGSRLLLQSFLDVLEALRRADIYIELVCANGLSDLGSALCLDLNMQKLCDHSGGGTVFEDPMADLLRRLKLKAPVLSRSYEELIAAYLAREEVPEA